MYVDRETKRLWLTPSDVTSFLGSKWLFAQKLALARGERERWETPAGGTGELTRVRGEQHEDAYLQELKARGLRVAEIPPALTAEEWKDSLAQTEAALTDATVDVIYQAHFALGQWRGQADFLERTADGGFEPVDTKLARHIKPYMIHQLCFYAEAMQASCGELPERFHVVLGDGERESFRTNDFLLLARDTRGALEAFAADDAALAATYPWPSESLELAGIAKEAEGIRRADDHLTLVAGITRRQIDRLAERSITTTSALAAAESEQRPKAMAEETWQRLRRQARLQKTEPPGWEILPPSADRGLDLLKPPSAGDIFYDIEGDPLFDAGGSLEYLHGLWWKDAESEEEVFTPIWAHSREQEKAAFERLIGIFMERYAADPAMHIYHYAAYEVRALKRLAQVHATCEQELDDLLVHKVFIDLFQVVRQSMQASVESYSIKQLERFYMDARTAEVKDGGSSIVEYERYRELAGTPEGDAILAEIAAYNEEDCKSTYLLRNWLRERHKECRQLFGWVGEPVPGKASEDMQNATPASGELTPKMQLLASRLLLRERLLAAAETEAEAKAEGQQSDRRAAGKRLAAELMLFNKREERAGGWSYYALLEMSPNELIDGPEAIGGLVPLPAGEAGGSARSFSFPPQDHRIKVGKSVKDAVHGYTAGRVIDIDEQRGRITIDLQGTARAHPPIAIFFSDYVATTPIDEALLDFSTSLIEPVDSSSPEEARPFAAARKLLERQPPYFGEQLNAETSAERRELLVELEHSYLVVQGPPGSGKTWLAADLIVDQLIRGKRVGIAAPSHTAVINLCHEVERVAHERGHVFEGMYRPGSGAGAKSYKSEHGLIAARSNDAIEGGEADLVAGTAWLFSRAAMRGRLDTLFIDEAGQFSLAHAIAAATAAKTLVLLGDPNQLPQVTKADHPDGSGESALAHAIGEHRTVEPARGLFLGESRRMAPELCEFVSETFYEGRLAAHESTHAHQPPGDVALGYLPVAHVGNGQSSPEEAEAVASLVARLVDQGVEPRRVLVVSPYNMQVDQLERRLAKRLDYGEDVEVLTVDKCQGRTVDVVIFSMATSGGEAIPRGLDFLFSANRFNVAISRARLAAYLVCSPELLQASANSVGDMRLLNAFAAFRAKATRL